MELPEQTYNQLQELNDFYEEQIYLLKQQIDSIKTNYIDDVLQYHILSLEHQLRKYEQLLFQIRSDMDQIHRHYYAKQER